MNTIPMAFSLWQPVTPDFNEWGPNGADRTHAELSAIPRTKVWEGTVDFRTDTEVQSAVHEALEELFRRFNIDHPEGYTGRSMSVNDVVCLGENSFRCAPQGWKLQTTPHESEMT